MITQYPGDTAQPVVWRGRCVWLRQLRVDDAKRYADFHAVLDPARIDHRIHTALPDPGEFVGTPQSGTEEIVFAAILNDDSGGSVLGIARAIRSVDENMADIAIVLRPDLEGQGLGRLLMGKLVNYCRNRGLRELIGQTSVDNRRMIDLAHAFRFVDAPGAVPGIVSLRLQLQPSTGEE